MKAIIDTAIWSLALRRKRRDLSPEQRVEVLFLSDLIEAGDALLVGPVRQELLSGITDEARFERLRIYLSYFEDLPVEANDWHEAARISNACDAQGVSGSSMDMLICALAMRLDAPIVTSDDDFRRYSRAIPIRVMTAAQAAGDISA